jgi:hypothetical protein
MSSATKATWNEPEKPRIPTRFDGWRQWFSSLQ